jgi:hypothetical membrane protein
MNLRNTAWFRIAGLCGVITPLVAFTCILLAIAYSPQFSWTENALSDLGVQEGLTAPLFNKLVGKVGSFTFVLATLALIAIGIFPENARPMHYFASVAFFALIPIAMLVLTWAFVQIGGSKVALFTLLTAIVAAVPWVIQFAVPYVCGVAIPETISALSASAWAISLGFMMLKKASRKDN